MDSEITAKELESFVTIKDAAKIKSVSPDTIRRHYAPLIERISAGRVGIKLRRLLSATPNKAA
jgi:hypothetical protein